MSALGADPGSAVALALARPDSARVCSALALAQPDSAQVCSALALAGRK